ncbi:MAG TPA: FlgD immunoglobulin-like domain containing protein [Candidatus Eisenbacteria bacterium]|nr:FlgD immunoglobulin-like domain containing protein [Candidatus Eisenbacteria bacterium]
MACQAQGLFWPSPGHGANGLGKFNWGTCATVWDADGAGPNPPLLVVASQGGIRAWDGSNFILFGGFPNGQVKSLAVFNGQLYVGGTFHTIGADSVKNVGRWDGSHWRTLGTGMTGDGNASNPQGTVNSMVVHDGVLCLGGSFVPISTNTWTGFATWDGTTLAAGPTKDAPITQLAEIATQLYCSTAAILPGVWRLESTGWIRIGTLADKDVLCLTSFNSDLICGGIFTHFFTGTSIRGVARFNGTQWVPMSSGIGPPGSEVHSLAAYNGSLFAAGKFDTAGAVTAKNVARWDGTAWSPTAGGLSRTMNPHVDALIAYNNELDAIGSFDFSATSPDTGIARWDGTRWLPFIAGINGPVSALLTSGFNAYVGGQFQFDWGPDAIRHVFWSGGSDVNELGFGSLNGAGGDVKAIALHTFDPLFGAEVVAGGAFGEAGGASGTQDIAGYTSVSGWQSIGGGLNNTVNAIANFGGTVYAAGSFTGSGGTTLHGVAKLVGGTWTDLGVGQFLPIHALTISGGNLIIGGLRGGKPFLPPADGVSAWDGVNYAQLGMADGPVNALAVYNGDIVAAGAFTSMDGVAAPAGVARRDATTGAWTAMGGGFALGVPYALAVYNGTLYLGGTTMLSLTVDYGRLQMWNGSSWVAPFGGLDGPVYALAATNDYLEIGGDFQGTDLGVFSPYWIRYINPGVAVEPKGTATLRLSECRPNPSRGAARIEFSLENAGPAHLQILDVAGRRVRGLVNGWLAAGPHEATWNGVTDDGRAVASGVYFERLDSDGQSLVRRLVWMR